MVAFPNSSRTLLEDRASGRVVARDADGSPQLSTVWLAVDGDELLHHTTEGRRKVEQLRRDPHVDTLAQRFPDRLRGPCPWWSQRG